ncbi:unnamed protein product, partial [marine sediment metagenome]
MGESEWQHASWVSTLGKWAWVIGVLNGLIGIFWSLFQIFSFGGLILFLGVSILGQVWNIIASIVGIAIALLIIRPKFSNPCGAKDWDALYGWVLNLGGTNIPWMFIWGLILFLFGWYGWGGLAV